MEQIKFLQDKLDIAGLQTSQLETQMADKETEVDVLKQQLSAPPILFSQMPLQEKNTAVQSLLLQTLSIGKGKNQVINETNI